jgi:hypothetical protein
MIAIAGSAIGRGLDRFQNGAAVELRAKLRNSMRCSVVVLLAGLWWNCAALLAPPKGRDQDGLEFTMA